MDPEEKINEDVGTELLPVDTPESEMVQEEPAQEEIMPEETESAISEPEPVDNNSATLSKYFPNVEVNDTNRAELEEAVAKLERSEKVMASLKELNMVLDDDQNAWVREFLIDLREGIPADKAVMKHIDLESASPIEGEEDYSQYAEMKNTRAQRIAEKEARKSKIAENEQNSIQVLREFKDNNNMSDEDFEKFFTVVQEVLSAAYDGSLTAKLLESLMYYQNRDVELANERAVGENISANKKISDFEEKEESEMAGDGMPAISGGGKVTESPKTESYASSFFKDVL